MEKPPVLFISHGAPTNITANNGYSMALKALGRKLEKPDLVLVVSAHWMTKGLSVTGAKKLQTIHDFYGFPHELYDIRYDAVGAVDFIPQLKEMPGLENLEIEPTRGLDHGAWGVLIHLFPMLDVPVLQLSMDAGLSFQGHYDLARSLKALRDKNVLFIGSGNATHNLQEAQFPNLEAGTPDWVESFDEWLKGRIVEKDHAALINAEQQNEQTIRNHPTPEHYIPLLYCLGLEEETDRADFFYEGFQYGALSMRCIKFAG